MTRTPTQTMATRCTHGRQAILDMDGIRRHVGGAWEPCEGQPPALEAADRLEAAGAGPLPTWPPARANAALAIAERCGWCGKSTAGDAAAWPIGQPYPLCFTCRNIPTDVEQES